MKGSLRDKAYSAIKKKIIYFELKPGQRIMESKISQELELGRTPVREALAMIENEKLIENDGSLGYVVTQLNEKDIEDYYNIRNLLEEFGASLLIQRVTEQDVQAIQDHLRKAEDIYRTEDLRKIIECDTEFHDLMYKASKSNVLYQTISGLLDKTIMIRAVALQHPLGRKHSLEDHKAMLEAIKERNLEKLISLIHTHFNHSQEYYKSMRPLIY